MSAVDTLSGTDLNRATAMSLGHKVIAAPDSRGNQMWNLLVNGHAYQLPDYVGDITHGWRIVEAKDIDLFNTHTALGFKATLNLLPAKPHWYAVGYGATRMEAALRALVHSVYGEKIDLDA